MKLEFRDGTLVRHPDGGPVKGHSNWRGTRTHSEGAELGPVTGLELGDVTAVFVGHPDIGPVKGDTNRLATHAEGAKFGSVGRQLGDGVTMRVRHPNVDAG